MDLLAVFCHFAAVTCDRKMISSGTLPARDGCDAFLKSKMPIPKFYFPNTSIISFF
jgi:hypothetical protein